MASARVVTKLVDPDVEVVNCHAISPDQKFLAMCPNNHEIRIYTQTGDGDYEHAETLAKHGQRVTGLSWSNDNRLVTCAEDRTAYVWAYNPATKEFVPGNVELRASRAGMCVSWSPDGQRFAVGLASKEVAVCHFDEAVRMWISKKKIGKSKASVSSLSWHPSSAYLAIGAFDRRMSVLDVEDGESFGQQQMQEDCGCWVNDVAFSPSGGTIAFVAQDSTVRFKELAKGPDGPVEVVQWRKYPFLQALFLTDDMLVAFGFDNMPVLLQKTGGAWQIVGSLDSGPEKAVSKSKSQFGDAQAAFKNMKIGEEKETSTTHTNTITSVTRLGETRFSTSALDGQVIVWELS